LSLEILQKLLLSFSIDCREMFESSQVMVNPGLVCNISEICNKVMVEAAKCEGAC